MVNMKKNILFFILLIIFVGACHGMPLRAEEIKTPAAYYPYDSDQFEKFVSDSYLEAGKKDTKEFYDWLEDAYIKWRQTEQGKGLLVYKDAENLGLNDFCGYIKLYLASIQDNSLKAEEEKKFAAGIHRFIKTIIPKFSLERGYEFCNVVKCGERQCFLQSVLIASLLQASGMDAGVVMVYINKSGEHVNNAHALDIVKLSDGNHIEVDASEKEPFYRHQGLFCEYKSGYRYVIPHFVSKDDDEIDFYTLSPVSSVSIPPSEIQTLNVTFLKSQFDDYRGEWPLGGLHYAKKTKAGLNEGIKYFKRAISTCPDNPLVVYFCGRCYEELGDKINAKKYFKDAYKLYSKYGWVPDGLKQKAGK